VTAQPAAAAALPSSTVRVSTRTLAGRTTHDVTVDAGAPLCALTAAIGRLAPAAVLTGPATFTFTTGGGTFNPAAGQVDGLLVYGDVTVDLHARAVTVAGVDVAFTAREFSLLTFLACHPRQAFSKAQLLEHVWHSRHVEAATVTEHIRRIRAKLDGRRLITTLRGAGYRFDAEHTPIRAVAVSDYPTARREAS
jgi:DNA-binding response OmpR family regulator